MERGRIVFLFLFYIMVLTIKTKVDCNVCTLNKFKNIKNKILIYRNAGGLGDILNMRMIFEELKKQYPDFFFDWAVPYPFFPAASKHPFVNELIHCGAYDEKDYLHVYNLTHACTRYEWAKGKSNDKNRADIWANHIGCYLKSHEMYMPDFSKNFAKLVEKLISIGWDSNKKIVTFAPRSAIAAKNLTFEHCRIVKNMTKDFFLVALHNSPILDLNELKIPVITDLNLEEAMSFIQLSDFVISTDTGHLHCAGGYKKPTLGIFGYTNGYEIAKYYPTIRVVQKHFKDEPGYCGPCNNYKKCHIAPNAKVKPCFTEITEEMLRKEWNFIVQNYK